MQLSKLKALLIPILRWKIKVLESSTPVVLTGSPRSGTTWLAGLLTKTGKRAFINEPVRRIRRRESVESRELGFSYRPYVDPTTSWSAAERFLSDIFTGRRPEFLLWGSDNSLSDIMTCRALVVKLISMNRMVPWILEHFSQIKGVLLLRHPCAVVGSQLRFVKARARTLHKDDEKLIRAKLPHLYEYSTSLRTEEEIRAVSWCLDAIVPLNASNHENLLVLTYESLVTNGPPELKRLFKFLGLDGYEKAVAKLREPSSVTGEWSVDHRRTPEEVRLARWKGDLSAEQAKRIMDVVKTFNISLYGESIEPDYSMLKDPCQISGIVIS